MKKLKLSTVNISAKDLLTRQQMRSVMGGSDDGSGGSDGPKCKTGNCSLSIQGSGGAWITRYGQCAGGTQIPPENSWEILFPSYTDCFCDVGLGDVPITTNGGVSRCTA